MQNKIKDMRMQNTRDIFCESKSLAILPNKVTTIVESTDQNNIMWNLFLVNTVREFSVMGSNAVVSLEFIY